MPTTDGTPLSQIIRVLKQMHKDGSKFNKFSLLAVETQQTDVYILKL